MSRIAVEQQLSFGRGMNDTAAPTEYRPDEFEALVNGRLSFDGQTVERRDGSVKLHASALNSGAEALGAIEYYTAANVQQLVLFVGDTMYTSEDEGVSWTQRATGLTTNQWDLVIMREGSANVLICANGGTNTYQWNGTTWATVSNIPDDIKYLAVFNDRLYASDGTITVVASAVGNIEIYSTPNGLSIRVQSHDGDTEVTGLFALGTVLLVFKENSVGYIEGYGFNTLEVEAGSRGVSRSVGCIAFRTIQAVGNQGVMWLSKRGLEYYELGGPITLVSRPIQNFMDSVNWSTIDGARGIPTAMWWAHRHEYRVALPIGTARNDNVVIYRPPHEDHPPAIWIDQHAATDDDTLYVDSSGYLERSASSDRDQGDVADGFLIIQPLTGQFMKLDSSGYLAFASALHDHACLFVADIASEALTTTPLSAGYAGFVRQLEKGDTDNAAADGTAGNSIDFRILTRPFLFGDPMARKRSRQIRVLSKQSALSTVTVKAVVDGVEQTAHNLSFTASTKPIPRKARVGGRGNTHQVEITSSAKVKISVAELSAEILRDAGR